MSEQNRSPLSWLLHDETGGGIDLAKFEKTDPIQAVLTIALIGTIGYGFGIKSVMANNQSASSKNFSSLAKLLTYPGNPGCDGIQIAQTKGDALAFFRDSDGISRLDGIRGNTFLMVTGSKTENGNFNSRYIDGAEIKTRLIPDDFIDEEGMRCFKKPNLNSEKVLFVSNGTFKNEPVYRISPKQFANDEIDADGTIFSLIYENHLGDADFIVHQDRFGQWMSYLLKDQPQKKPKSVRVRIVCEDSERLQYSDKRGIFAAATVGKEDEEYVITFAGRMLRELSESNKTEMGLHEDGHLATQILGGNGLADHKITGEYMDLDVLSWGTETNLPIFDVADKDS